MPVIAGRSSSPPGSMTSGSRPAGGCCRASRLMLASTQPPRTDEPTHKGSAPAEDRADHGAQALGIREPPFVGHACSLLSGLSVSRTGPGLLNVPVAEHGDAL